MPTFPSALGSALAGKRLLLIIGGGIAAYKALELVRRARERGMCLDIVMTAAAKQFIAPLSFAALASSKVYDDLFSLTDETDMGHIQLSRKADAVLVIPATADLMAKAAQGLANDLASTLLLATDKKPIFAPAMNVRMWNHPATQRNLAILRGDGAVILGPVEGDMACGEFGLGRMLEPSDIIDALEEIFKRSHPVSAIAAPAKKLNGRRAIVTAGPTQEPIDPVRYISNKSSGKQGYAIAEALAQAGADVVLVSGPVDLSAPPDVVLRKVETAQQMLAATQAALPADIFIAAAAVADWRIKNIGAQKTKKDGNGPPTLELIENPDILATIASPGIRRPRLVVGFAAETENLVANAQKKLQYKHCDLIVANDVGADAAIFGGDHNLVTMVDQAGVESWQRASKAQVAQKLVEWIAARLPENAL